MATIVYSGQLEITGNSITFSPGFQGVPFDHPGEYDLDLRFDDSIGFSWGELGSYTLSGIWLVRGK